MEDLSVESESAIKCRSVSCSSCQVFLPPAVSQQGLICLQLPSICPPAVSLTSHPVPLC